MNAILQLAIAEGIAAIDRVMDAPAEPFGYGSDLHCDTDIDEAATEIDGDDPLVFAQALVRRLDCPRGQLPDDPNYGIDLRAFLNTGVPFSELGSLESQITTELRKDDRVASVAAKVTFSSAGTELTVRIVVTPVDPALGSFRLTLAVTSAAVILEAMEAA